MNLSDLKKPFAPDKVSWRVGSTTGDKSKGMALCYIDARDVQDRLDEVCGQDGWQCRYVPMHDKKTVCEIGIRIVRSGGALLGGITTPDSIEWLWKADGAGDSDIEAEKGALSDAFKRAAVRWGVGRYLYDLDSPWVELDTYEKQGKVFAKGIKASERKRLEALLAKGAGQPTTAPTKPQEAQKGQQMSQTPPNDGKDALLPPKPRKTLGEWVAEAKASILASGTSALLTAWLQDNNDKLETLKETNPAIYNAISVEIQHRKTELERI